MRAARSLRVDRRVRRRFEATLAAAALAVCALPMAALALGIRLTLGRPVLFLQDRVGRGGVPFRLIKFRTMREAHDANGEPLPDEARLGPFGRLVRRTRLDEIPGLVNVLRGEMSLVGPRPLIPAAVAKLGPLAARRSEVRPGLTGWAQVNGNTLLSDRDKLLLDLWYVEHRSLRLDLTVLLLTVGVVLFGEHHNQANIERARNDAGGPGRHG